MDFLARHEHRAVVGSASARAVLAALGFDSWGVSRAGGRGRVLALGMLGREQGRDRMEDAEASASAETDAVLAKIAAETENVRRAALKVSMQLRQIRRGGRKR